MERYWPAWHAWVRGPRTIWPPRAYYTANRYVWPWRNPANVAHRSGTSGYSAKRHLAETRAGDPSRATKLSRAYAGTRCHATPTYHGRGETGPPADQSAAPSAENQSRRCLCLGTARRGFRVFRHLAAPAAAARSLLSHGAALAAALAVLPAVAGSLGACSWSIRTAPGQSRKRAQTDRQRNHHDS